MIGVLSIIIGILLLLMLSERIKPLQGWLYPERKRTALVLALVMLIGGIGEVALFEPEQAMLRLALGVLVGVATLATAWVVQVNLIQTTLMLAGALMAIRAIMVFIGLTP